MIYKIEKRKVKIFCEKETIVQKNVLKGVENAINAVGVEPWLANMEVIY